MPITYIVTGNVFTIWQGVVVARPDNLKVTFVNDIFEIVQDVTYTQKIKILNVGNVLSLQEAVNIPVKILRVGNSFNLQQSAKRGSQVSIQHYINFYQSTRKVLYQIIGNQLLFLQFIQPGRGIFNDFTISQVLTLSKSQKPIIQQSLGLQQFVSIYKQNDPDFILGI